MNNFTHGLLVLGQKFVGLREEGGRNRGPQIDAWNEAQGVECGSSWCVTSQLGIAEAVCKQIQCANPFPRTGGVHALWRWLRAHCPDAILREPAPGCWAFHDSGKGRGHMGLVEAVGEAIETLEGNTNAAGSREGEWFMSKTRPFSYWNLGFADPSVPLLMSFEKKAG